MIFYAAVEGASRPSSSPSEIVTVSVNALRDLLRRPDHLRDARQRLEGDGVLTVHLGTQRLVRVRPLATNSLARGVP